MTNPTDTSEREHVLDQVLDARSLTEIKAAEQELRSWLKSNPEDAGIREAFEGLSLMRDIAEEQEAERARPTDIMLEIGNDNNEARERLSEQVLSANTLLEIEDAKIALRQWMQLHPEEQGMRDGFEQLYTIQEITEAEEASSPNRSLNSAQAV